HLADDRTIPSHCVIWTAGNQVSPVITSLALPKTKDGRLKVNEFFEVEGAPDVYALGDNAAQMDPHTRQPYVATAQVALRQGRALAAQIEAALTGRPRRPFDFKLLGEMVPLSRHKAVADLSGLKLVGFPAWFLWKTVYMLKLPTWAARLRVVLDWTVELFFERDVSELTVDERGEAGDAGARTPPATGSTPLLAASRLAVERRHPAAHRARHPGERLAPVPGAGAVGPAVARLAPAEHRADGRAPRRCRP